MAHATRMARRLLPKALLFLAAACTVANPKHRPDAGPDPDSGPNTDPDAGPNPGVTPITCQPNLAFRADVTKRYSSYEAAPWSAAYVVDGKTDSSAGSNGYSSEADIDKNHTEWIELDLRTRRTFDTVVLYPRNDAGHIGDGFPIDFTIQVWNGSEWLTRVTRTSYQRPGNSPQVFSWQGRDTTNKIKIEATRLAQVDDRGTLKFHLQLAEIQVADSKSDTDPNVNQLMGATVTADSSYELEGWAVTNVIDGRRDSSAESAGYASGSARIGGNHTETLYISTPCRKTYSKVALFPRNSLGFVGAAFPIDFTISFWSGTAWDEKVVHTGYGQPGDAPQVFSWGSPYITNQIRIQATNLRPLIHNGQTQYWFELAEVEAYP